MPIRASFSSDTPSARSIASASAPSTMVRQCGQIARTSRCAIGRRQRGSNEIWIDLHVDQPADHADGVIGMDGREHDVPGERGLDRHARRVDVAALADHDDVRILPQDVAQAAGEGEADPLVDLHLMHAVQAIFHRILDGEHVAALAVDGGEAGIQRGGLARPGGAAEHDQAVRRGDLVEQEAQHAVAQAELLRRRPQRLLVEQPKTIFSPSTIGELDTRMSSGRRRIWAVMRPSCGRRRSATSMPASTLIREVIAGCSARGTRNSSCRMPSIRMRTAVPSSSGSIWMSDAPWL